jgi:hypothetical protein
MKVDFSKELIDLDGKTVDSSATDKTPATVRKVVCGALIASYPDEANLNPEEKVKRWNLALRVQKELDPIDFKTDEIALMKKLVGKAYGPMIVGQVWEVLENGISE